MGPRFRGDDEFSRIRYLLFPRVVGNDEMHVEKVLGPGPRSFVVLPKLKPGQYDFIDEFNPITGELTVIAK